MLPTRNLTAILILTLLALTACTAPATPVAEAPPEAATPEPTATATVTPIPTITPTPTPAIPFEADFEVRVEVGEDGEPLYFAELDAGEGLRTYQVTPVADDGTLLVLTDEDGVSYVYDQSGELVELVDGTYAIAKEQVVVVTEGGISTVDLEGNTVEQVVDYGDRRLVFARDAEGNSVYYRIDEEGVREIEESTTAVMIPYTRSVSANVDVTKLYTEGALDEAYVEEVVRDVVDRWIENENEAGRTHTANIIASVERTAESRLRQQVEILVQFQQDGYLTEAVSFGPTGLGAIPEDAIDDGGYTKERVGDEILSPDNPLLPGAKLRVDSLRWVGHARVYQQPGDSFANGFYIVYGNPEDGIYFQGSSPRDGSWPWKAYDLEDGTFAPSDISSWQDGDEVVIVWDQDGQVIRLLVRLRR